MEILSGCKRFIVCIFSQSKPRGLKLLRSFFFFFFFFFFLVSLNYNNYSSHGFADVTFTILPYTGVPLSRLRFRNILPQ